MDIFFERLSLKNILVSRIRWRNFIPSESQIISRAKNIGWNLKKEELESRSFLEWERHLDLQEKLNEDYQLRVQRWREEHSSELTELDIWGKSGDRWEDELIPHVSRTHGLPQLETELNHQLNWMLSFCRHRKKLHPGIRSELEFPNLPLSSEELTDLNRKLQVLDWRSKWRFFTQGTAFVFGLVFLIFFFTSGLDEIRVFWTQNSLAENRLPGHENAYETSSDLYKQKARLSEVSQLKIRIESLNKREAVLGFTRSLLEAPYTEERLKEAELALSDWEILELDVQDEENQLKLLSTEVNQAFYESLMEDNPSQVRDLSLPVNRVQWLEALHFADRLSEFQGFEPCHLEQEGVPVIGCNGWRLPTRAEWSAMTLKYPEKTKGLSSQLRSAAEHGGRAFDGNLSEWLQDSEGQLRQLGGASHLMKQSSTVFQSADPLTRDPQIGFRLVRSVP